MTQNGGYTPLHIAMQFGHENIFNLLVQVYGANQDIRDYSGRKARQYLVSQEAAVSQDTFHRITAAATLRNKSKEKACRERSWFPTNWLVERSRETYDGSLQSVPGCGNEQYD
ncbi:ankyrin repeat domain-containing protein SOWAHB-like [Polyergus mexicanus]|uniref:ankyrin repeat domain-containing protein SOWAHB-like n=1 Tax=Polyergus mexicanus TaxID=615972 RepID=UPI0038B4D421